MSEQLRQFAFEIFLASAGAIGAWGVWVTVSVFDSKRDQALLADRIDRLATERAQQEEEEK